MTGADRTVLPFSAMGLASLARPLSEISVPGPDKTPAPPCQRCATELAAHRHALDTAQKDRIDRLGEHLRLESDTALEARLAQVLRDSAEALADIESSHLRVVRACLEAVLPEAVMQGAATALAHRISTHAQLRNLGALELRHAPDAVHIAERAVVETSVVALADPAMNPGQVSLKWRDGSFDVNTSAVVAACLAMLPTAPEVMETDHG